MSIRRFARWLVPFPAIFCLAALPGAGMAAALALACANVIPTTTEPASDIATFSGSIDAASVAAFIATHADRRVGRVVLDSPGGDVTAGIELGNWIRDRCADVEVPRVCASACANYAFIAGRRKIIDDGAIVIWHGSALQKNFRERLADCDRRLGELAHAGGDLADVYIRELVVEDASCRTFGAMRDAQDAFFERVGASEYVTRMGQEPRAFHAIWTASLAAMASLGIADVEAPANYGSHDYMKRFNRVDDPEPILVLGFDAAGHVVELAR